MTKIMIVDDEPDIREMLSLMMQKQGFETETAVDGSDFLKKIDDFQPDLVTLDIMMPGLMTIEILEKLQEKNCKPKIIILTVVQYSEDEKKWLFEKGNVVDYITKPFNIDIFLETVKKHLEYKEHKVIAS